MQNILAAAAANCGTGNWQQKWDCGWHQPTTGAANAAIGGAGSAVLVVIAIAAVLWLLSKLGGSRRPATS